MATQVWRVFDRPVIDRTTVSRQGVLGGDWKGEKVVKVGAPGGQCRGQARVNRGQGARMQFGRAVERLRQGEEGIEGVRIRRLPCEIAVEDSGEGKGCDKWPGSGSTSDRLSGLRPGRLVTTYSQTVPRRRHREQVGFSLEHLTLDSPQARQLSHSLWRALARREDAGDRIQFRSRTRWLAASERI